MSGFFSPLGIVSAPAAASQPSNPNRSFEPICYPVDGLSVTSGGSTHTLGSYVSMGTVTNNLSGIIFEAGGVGTTTLRTQYNIRANGSTIIVPDYHIQPSQNSMFRIRIPLIIAAGTTLEVAVRAQQASQSLRCGLTGIIASQSAAPGFSTMTSLDVGTGSTLAGTVDVPNTNTWTQLVASSGANDYGALAMVVGNTGTAPASGYRATVYLGLGSAGNEVEYYRTYISVSTGAPYIIMANPPVIEKLVPAGSRISAKIEVTTSNADVFRIGLWGLS